MRNRKEFKRRAKKAEDKLKEDVEKEGGFTKKDILAMIGSAFLTIFPVCVLVVVGLGLLMLWLFRAL